MTSPTHWLLKTEPSTYSLADLRRDERTNWDGIRNYQARNFLRLIKKDDLALIYHSGDERSVVGIARVIKEAYPDPDSRKKGDWVQVDLEFMKAFNSPVPLAEIKTRTALQSLLLLKQSRLSVIPVTAAHYQTILKMGAN